MSDFSLTLVLRFKTSKIAHDMAKVSIKSERITPFGGLFHVRELFSRYVGPVIDKVLGLRCTSCGYQYSEIAGSLSSVYFCGGDCVEDVTSHLMPHLSLHPTLRTCSSDTILRGISELAPVMLDGVRGYWAGTTRNCTCSGWRFRRWRARRRN